jgi:poly-gamma-glutamate capsule biosynthesis protein CapA/YwtB (metallophosphatase superfamily)
MSHAPSKITLFLCGDVMTGRGIDQILPHPCLPQLHEPWVQSAEDYVALAERSFGPIQRPVAFDYVWGDALLELQRFHPDLRIINLETAITTSEDWCPEKGVHYRMNPGNAPCLTAAIDCCSLANNHVLDWGQAGLIETLETLRSARVRVAGAGLSPEEASAPAIVEVNGKGRVLVFACAAHDCGVPEEWNAEESSPGIHLLDDLSLPSAQSLADRILKEKQAGDIVVLSIHWGSNWEFNISKRASKFAHHLIDAAAVDVVHGHSSHHVKGIEVYRERLILYGCGDFLNDYEGIGGYEQFRPDCSLMYFPSLESGSGKLLALTLVPTQIRGFRVMRANDDAVAWLQATLNREGETLGTQVEREPGNDLLLHWLYSKGSSF